MKILLRSLWIGCLLIALTAGCGTNSEEKRPLDPNENVDELTDPSEEQTDEARNETDNEKSSNDDALDSEPEIVAENEAFRIFEPKESSVIKDKLIVKGEARVFEGAVNYYLEDGHNILAEGVVQASAGAPEWGSFEIETEIERPTSPNGILMLYELSAKDGSQLHTLIVPVSFD